MSKRLIASACALAVVIAGCGKDTAAERKTACAKAAAAMTAYHRAGSAVGANFLTDSAGDRKVAAAAAVFRARLRRLAPLTDSTEREEIEELGRTLELHGELMTALAAHNLALAHRLDTPAFEEALDRGQKNFRTICKLPAEQH